MISKATNSYTKTHPIQYNFAVKCGEPYKAFLHAEMLAIIRAKGKGFKLIVERYNSLGEPLLAMPCPICQLAIKEAGIKRVEYTI